MPVKSSIPDLKNQRALEDSKQKQLTNPDFIRLLAPHFLLQPKVQPHYPIANFVLHGILFFYDIKHQVNAISQAVAAVAKAVLSVY